MAKYSDIKGFTVQTLSTDTVASQAAGGSWASGSAMNTGRAAYGAAGTLTSALAATGQSSSGNNGTVNVEQYDGSSWTETSNVNSARRAVAGSGASYTNALIFGGLGPLPSGSPTSTLKTAITESWNGSAWTEVGDLTTAVYYGGPACQGTNTATLNFGGATPSGTANNQSWNGSSWTEVNNLNTARAYIFGIGTSTAALAAGGFTTTTVAINEQWDGTSWTESTDLNAANYQGGSAGTSTASLVFGGGGGPGQAATTEAWDGSSWTEVGDISEGNETIRGNGAGSSAAWAAGGSNPPFTTETQEWSAPAVFNQQVEGQLFFNSTTNTFKETVQDIAGGTWSSGGAVNTARSRFGGATNATQNAGLVFGAGDAPRGQTEEYNGTAWSEQNDMNTGRYISYGGGGTQTACITAGGLNPAGSPIYATVVAEEYNGTSWTEVNDLNEGRIDCATFGTAEGAILVGGGEAAGSPGTVASVESWNGTSWSETTDIPATRQEMGAWGATSTAGAIVGGTQDGPNITAETLEWDGSTWTAGGDYPTVLKYTTVFGTLNSAIVAGGENASAKQGVCAHYNGTSWTEVAELATARMGSSSNGTALSGFAASGEAPPGATTVTEEWNVSLSNKTITSS